MSINKPPRGKLLEVTPYSPYAQKHPPHPNAGVQGRVKPTTRRLRRPERCTRRSSPGEAHGEHWEAFRDAGRFPCPGSWREISLPRSCLPVAGTPHEISGADSLLQRATVPGTSVLVSGFSPTPFCKPMAENTHPVIITQSKIRDQGENMAEAETPSSQAKQLNC